MKKKLGIGLLALLIVIASLILITGGRITSVMLNDYSVSEAGDSMTIKVGVASSMGYIRTLKAKQKEDKEYITFYSTYGLNSNLGAKNEFLIELQPDCDEICFYTGNGEYELQLFKNSATKEWERASHGETAVRELILTGDNTNAERNHLLIEDIEYFQKELPKRHKNLFSNVSRDEFMNRTNQLIDNTSQLNNKQVFVELNKIIASVGDAHTSINYWDGYSYPLRFWIFGSDVYVVNADTSLEGMMYSKVLKIDGTDIDLVMEQLTTLISHENESWISAMLPDYLQSPVYLYGLGILQKEEGAVFTVEKDGEVKDFTVTALEYGESADYSNKKTEDTLVGVFDKYYGYEYLPDNKTIYFEYNVCADMDSQSFKDFNEEMFDFIDNNDVDKIIVDLRNNSGGNSEILNPFTKRLKSYVKENTDIKVYILVGRYTFSSGMFAIYRVKEAAPEALSVGEPTGGALDCYGEVKTMNLPNSNIPIGYSTKYFEFSKTFTYKNEGIGTFLPDVSLQPTMEDYQNGNDVVLKFALDN